MSRPTINGVALKERFMALLSKRHRDGVRLNCAAFSRGLGEPLRAYPRGLDGGVVVRLGSGVGRGGEGEG